MIFNVVSFFPSRVILYGLWSGLVVCFFVGGVWSSRSFTYWYSSKSAFAFSSHCFFQAHVSFFRSGKDVRRHWLDFLFLLRLSRTSHSVFLLFAAGQHVLVNH